MDYALLKTIIPRRTQQWSKADVSNWLSFIGLERMREQFGKKLLKQEKEGIDGMSLRGLNEKNLIQGMGIKSRIFCKKLLNWIFVGFDLFDQGFEEKEEVCQFYGDENWGKSQQWIKCNVEELETNDRGLMNQLEKKKQCCCDVLILKRVEGKQNIFHKFRQKDCKIGRDESCQIQITGQKIDPFHVLISYHDGNFSVRNIAAKQVTYIKVDSRIQISHGMLVEMGSNIFQFYLFSDQNLQIKIVQGLNCGQIYEYPITKNKILIGRKPTNDINFPRDNTLSNLHGRITYSNNKWYIEDLVTTNGTWIQIEHEEQITNGMVFKLGQTNFQFQCELQKLKEDSEKQQNIFVAKIQNQLCLICGDNVKNMFVFPCSHCPFCEQCSHTATQCVICGQKIQKTTKIYRS